MEFGNVNAQDFLTTKTLAGANPQLARGVRGDYQLLVGADGVVQRQIARVLWQKRAVAWLVDLVTWNVFLSGDF